MSSLIRLRWWLLGALVALCSSVASAWWVFEESRPRAAPVAVAASALLPGSRLDPQAIRWISWPTALVPAGVVGDARRLVGRYVRVPLARGVPILESALAPEGSHGGLAAIITPGRRALTVRVNEVVGVAGFALPGNYVDVLVNGHPDPNSTLAQSAQSRIVLEHVLVLAIAQEDNPDQTRPHVVNAVTLEVTPEEAERLDLARSIGTLSLVLRNQMDDQAVNPRAVNATSLFSSDLTARAAVASSPRIARLDGNGTVSFRTCCALLRGMEWSRVP